MEYIPRLQDHAFDTFIGNCENLMKQPKFRQRLQRIPIPPLICDKIFNGLNKYYCGIPSDILKHFTSKLFNLKEIKLSGRNLGKEDYEILSEHKLIGLHLEHLKDVPIEKILYILDSSLLTNLTMNNIVLPSISKLIKRLSYKKRTIDYKLVKSYLPFSNIRRLNITGSSASNAQFFHMTKRMEEIEYLNISGTAITDIRLLKHFPNLRHLDCSRLPIGSESYIIHLLCLSKLEYLQIGNPKHFGSKLMVKKYIEPIIKNLLPEKELADYQKLPNECYQKIQWSFSQFLEMANWEDLKFFCNLGNSLPSTASVT